MGNGDLALVLHAHLPYVRSAQAGSLEEDWYFQALQECYLPLLAVLEAAAGDRRQQPRLTLGLSPTLLSLLADRELNARFLPWLVQRQLLLERAPAEHRQAAQHLGEQLAAVARSSSSWRCTNQGRKRAFSSRSASRLSRVG
ncbi:MAG: DUF1957 domain-containing protein, partial [Prochlorococcaceae cyanobacterium]